MILPNKNRLRPFLPLILLGMLAAGCMPPDLTVTPTGTVEPLPTEIVTVSGPRESPTPAPPPPRLGSVTPAPTPTRTVRPTATIIIPTATAELLACPEIPPALPVQPARVLYANNNRLFVWDQTNEVRSVLPLPNNALAPLISDDGALAVYTLADAAFDTPRDPIERIPLWVYDIGTNAARELTSFPTGEVRGLYPDSPLIRLQIEWLPGRRELLVQVYPSPWGSGSLWPSGPLYVVDAVTGETRQLLPAGGYERYGVRPDGRQIAVLDSAVFSPDGTVRWDVESLQQGRLQLLDLESAGIIYETPIRLPDDPWGFTDPIYAPDGSKVAYNAASGIEILSVADEGVLVAPLTNTCLEENNCYWTDSLPVIWQPDSRSFYSLQTANDYFDARAQTTLSQVYTELGGWIETILMVRANPATIGFSPNRRILTYWNHPDPDTPDANGLNWDQLQLVDIQQGIPRRYAARFVLRMLQWNPDSRRFLFTYSPFGGPNPVPVRLALGDVCQPPVDLAVPEGLMVTKAQWLNGYRFLAWTAPAGGIPDRYDSPLFLYDLSRGSGPIYVGDLFYDSSNPYGAQDQVVVIRE